MSDGRRVFRALLNWAAVLAIVVVTAAALLAGAAVLSSDGLPGDGLSPDGFVSSGEVTTVEGTLYLDRTGQPTVVGAIDNDAGNPVTNVSVSVTIYEDGEKVATRETSPLAPTIPDGTAAPYEVRFAPDAEPDEFTANVTYDDGGDVGGDVALVDSRVTDTTQHTVTVSGSTTNADDSTVERPTVIVTFYDEDGTVIGARTDHLSPLEPDETSGFTVRYSTLGDVPSLAGEYADHTVVVMEGSR